MKFLKDFLGNAFRSAAQDIRHGVQNVKDNLAELKKKMDADPQVRVAVIHCATYAACLIIPAAVGVYLSVKNDGTPNIWRVPDGSTKIEMVEPE